MATELADGVWRFELSIANAYLFVGEEVVLVDAGTPFDAGRLDDELSTAGYCVPDVDRVLVTHFDFDHVGSLAKLSRLSASIHMPGPDASYLTRAAAPPLFNRKGLFQRALRPLIRCPDQPIEGVLDGDEIAGLTAFRTPGHSPGHTVYVSEDAGVAFLGDLVMGSDEALSLPPWFINYDTAEVRASVRSLDRRAPAFEVAAQGHGEPLTTGGRRALAVLAESVR